MGCGASQSAAADERTDTRDKKAEKTGGPQVLPNTSELLQQAKVPQADNILPLLYLGNIAFARDKAKLDELGIKRIVNATTHPPCFPNDFAYETVHINDDRSADIRPLLRPAAAFMADGLDNGEPVFVHCEMGMSRSTTIIMAYLMEHKGWSLRRAYLQTKLVRPCVRVTKTFIYTLLDYERLLLNNKDLDFELLAEEGLPQAAADPVQSLIVTANSIQLLFHPTPETVKAHLTEVGLLEGCEVSVKIYQGVEYDALEAQEVPTMESIVHLLQEDPAHCKAVCQRLAKEHPNAISPFVK
eukprot:TRINITY_DN5336_c0_g2_i1.p2 TRINITY_DN5336_c0_g2~~TRINITY_DN5336_c0_g2_i1.p2  ORF type:complete len:299 (+),score=137.87 TRINITY_DN5336_c0_g2_i1:108-1004(+)